MEPERFRIKFKIFERIVKDQSPRGLTIIKDLVSLVKYITVK